MCQSDKIPVTQLLEVCKGRKDRGFSGPFSLKFCYSGAIWEVFWVGKHKGFRLVIVEIDSPEAFKLLGEADQTNPNFDIICGFLKLVGLQRKANLCAELMAEDAWDSAGELIQTPTALVQKEIEKDLLKVSFGMIQKMGARYKLLGAVNLIDGSILASITTTDQSRLLDFGRRASP